MKRIAILMLAGMCLLAAAASAADRVRRPAFAGSFYPEDPRALALTVDTLLDGARPPARTCPVAIVSPHAGYVYSGQIAADAWNQAAGSDIDLVVILGVNHRSEPFRGVSVYDGRGYRTPLGTAAIDRGVVAALLECDAVRFVPAAHADEHSVEVQVPFAQTLFPDAKIVACVVGSAGPAERAAFARALAAAVGDRRALIAASSDLSHYPPYDAALDADHATLRAMASLDPDVFATALRRGRRAGAPGLSTCACGENPVMMAMACARELGAAGGRVVSYANSGDSPIGDLGRVVGYGAVAFVADRPGPDAAVLDHAEQAALDAASDYRPDAVALDPTSRRALLRLARRTIERTLAVGMPPPARRSATMPFRTVKRKSPSSANLP